MSGQLLFHSSCLSLSIAYPLHLHHKCIHPFSPDQQGQNTAFILILCFISTAGLAYLTPILSLYAPREGLSLFLYCTSYLFSLNSQCISVSENKTNRRKRSPKKVFLYFLIFFCQKNLPRNMVTDYQLVLAGLRWSLIGSNWSLPSVRWFKTAFSWCILVISWFKMVIAQSKMV